MAKKEASKKAKSAGDKVAKEAKSETKSAAKSNKSAKAPLVAKARKALAPIKAAKNGRLKGADLVRKVVERPMNTGIVDFGTGDTVNVYVKVREGEKERLQVFKGIVLKLGGAGFSRSFTVRKISAGVGVERTFPFSSPVVDRVEILTSGKVRRSKLYYLRGLEGKAAKIESELVSTAADAPAAE